MTQPTINREMFAKIAEIIGEHPELHNQGVWEHRDDCGTTRCIAGWAIHLYKPDRPVWQTVHGHNGTPEGWDSYSAAGAELLGLTADEADVMFFGFDNDQAYEACKHYAEHGRDVPLPGDLLSASSDYWDENH